ncbi:MAG: phosphatase PAP2 family protein [Thermoleophilia bacterium]
MYAHPTHSAQSSGAALRSAAGAVRSRLRGWRGEALVFALAVLAYQGGRVFTRGGADLAVDNAHRVLGLERALGIDVEAGLQRHLVGTVWLDALDWVYLLAQQVILAAGLLAIYALSRRVYRVLRTTVLVTWLLALPVYALFPTAPPRLAALGLVDTVSATTPVDLSGGSTTIYNPYAAVPSLHAGFALALGVALALSTRSWIVRAVGVAWGPLVMLATLATANHFVVDVAAGVVLTGMGFAVALAAPRIRPALRRAAARRPVPAGRLARS